MKDCNWTQACTAAPSTNDELSLRRPLRRRSYQEACTDDDDDDSDRSVQGQRLRVLVQRLSTDLGDSYKDPSTDTSDDASRGTLHGEDHVHVSLDADVLKDDRLRSADQEFDVHASESVPMQLAGTTAVSDHFT